jgi:hypothetical protein
MKNSLMTIRDEILLRKRSIIETVNDELKNSCQIEYSRHRRFTNFLSNIVAGFIAYRFLPKKPSIKYQTIKSNQLTFYESNSGFNCNKIFFTCNFTNNLSISENPFKNVIDIYI